MSTTEAGRLTATKPDGNEGLSFQAVIEATRRLDELSCARVVGQVADAVHAAQKAGQPLGTLSPAAIIVARDGSIKLAPGARSPRYSAPEQLRGGAGDRRTDVFALGVVLWEALAHEPLFGGAGDEAIKQAVLAGAVRPPSEHNANVPAELDAICQRALAAEPANRYQSAKVMAAEIDAVLSDAGYPEDNEAIASYVVRALAAEASKPVAPGGKTAPLPSVEVAPAPASKRPASKTLQPMAPTGPRPASSTQPPAAARSTGTIPPPATRSPSPTQPPAKAGTLRSSSGTQPPPAGAPVASTLAGVPIPAAPLAGAPLAGAPLASTVAPSAVPRASATQPPPTTLTGGPGAAAPWSSPTGTSPSPFTANRPPAQTVTVGSWADPPTTIDAKPPAWDDAPVETVVRGSMYPPAGAVAAKPLVSTAFLGSNAIEPAPGGTHVGLPPAMVTPAPVTQVDAHAPAFTELPSFAPPEMPASRDSSPPELKEPKDPKAAPVQFRPMHPQPRLKESIATAATAETPHLGGKPAADGVSTLMGMSRAMMVAPAAPSTPVQVPDNEFEDERNSNPADVVSLPQQEKGRDVLAGWGWSTGATETIPDDEDLHDTTRAGRKRLVVTIGAALAVVIAISVVAFAFRGSKKPSDETAANDRAPAVSATAPVTAPGTAVNPAVSPTAPAADPSPATPAVGSANTATPTADPTPGSATPPSGATPGSATPSSATPGTTAAVDPPKPVADPPKPIDPPKPVADPPKPVDPPKPAATDPKPAADPKPVADPPKLPPKHDPPKLAAKPPEPVKPPTHKPPEPKKPPEAAKHTPAPERVAHAQPIDPYGATPDKPRVDPAAAYKSGLQQYARGDTTGALATFRGSLSSNPGYAPTWRGIGLVYEKQGNKGQARQAFKRYLQLSPGASDADQIRDRLERLGS